LTYRLLFVYICILTPILKQLTFDNIRCQTHKS